MYDIDSLPALIELGRLTENDVCEIEFDVTTWLELYPTGAFSITYIRPGETTVYPVDAGDIDVSTVDDVEVLTWTVSDTVTAIAGSGSVVIQLTENDAVKRSNKVQTFIADGHAAAGDPPEPLASYIEKWGAVDATVEGVSVGEEATATVTQDANGTHFAFVLPYIPI